MAAIGDGELLQALGAGGVGAPRGGDDGVVGA